MAKRTDANQKEIVEMLRGVGAKVFDAHILGRGAPDLLVNYHGALYLLEVKTATGNLTKDQVAFHADWPVKVVRTPLEALQAIGLEVD